MLLSRRFRSAVVRFQEGEFLAAAVGRPREFLSQPAQNVVRDISTLVWSEAQAGTAE